MSGVGRLGLFLLLLHPGDEEGLVQVRDALVVSAKEVVHVRNLLPVLRLERRPRADVPVNIVWRGDEGVGQW